MAYRFCRRVLVLTAALVVAVSAVPHHFARADDDGGDEEDVHKAPSMHSLAAKPPLPRAHKDFSKFRYTPPGDKIVEQAAANRLLFWTKDGKPDGYAQRRGNSIIYYDAQGKAVRVQRLTEAELAD
ncbi:hypothetical protein [Acetobacter thailandicus]|uniref:Uncharacterized protein n=1 Tax=Acetobacter thailandicus TaxID=1502842 RepID=A0ABT3QBE4_9PROT|nr:hypothetical protein [Acetobacter thailandicus]MCX2562628.1 hypothetical protein [Acetobacter thailandicus]NHN94694.1 hypothetical protein [Acetobacter thailandicus]